MNKLQEHISSIGKSFDEEVNNGLSHDGGKLIKSHILASQITTIELIKEEVEGMKDGGNYSRGQWPRYKEMEVNAHNAALTTISFLLDSVLKELKK